MYWFNILSKQMNISVVKLSFIYRFQVTSLHAGETR